VKHSKNSVYSLIYSAHHTHTPIHTHTYIYIYIHTYIHIYLYIYINTSYTHVSQFAILNKRMEDSLACDPTLRSVFWDAGVVDFLVDIWYVYVCVCVFLVWRVLCVLWGGFHSVLPTTLYMCYQSLTTYSYTTPHTHTLTGGLSIVP
jgi:hypothetical protein